MRSLALLALLPLLSSALAGRHHARTYDTHQYYALELSSGSSETSGSSEARSHDLQIVYPFEELEGHWLVRVPGFTPQNGTLPSGDNVVKRWSGLRKRHTGNLNGDHLRSFTPLNVKRRVKRDGTHIPRRPHSLDRRDDTEFVYAQTDLGILDPLLNQQWHLINQEMADIELNVTGLWARGVTGKGVKVALIDDGLDMHSDDLADNFVSYHESSYDN